MILPSSIGDVFNINHAYGVAVILLGKPERIYFRRGGKNQLRVLRAGFFLDGSGGGYYTAHRRLGGIKSMAQNDGSSAEVSIYQNADYYLLEYTNDGGEKITKGIPKSGDRQRDLLRVERSIRVTELVPNFETEESADLRRLTEEEHQFLSHQLTACICPTECDCQNPPPENWDGKNGVWLTSDHCPVHNINPVPYPDCRTHDDN